MTRAWLWAHLWFSGHYRCEWCGQSFRSRALLERHADQDHSERRSPASPRYLCETCDGLFDTRDELAAHELNVHSIQERWILLNQHGHRTLYTSHSTATEEHLKN